MSQNGSRDPVDDFQPVPEPGRLDPGGFVDEESLPAAVEQLECVPIETRFSRKDLLEEPLSLAHTSRKGGGNELPDPVFEFLKTLGEGPVEGIQRILRGTLQLMTENLPPLGEEPPARDPHHQEGKPRDEKERHQELRTNRLERGP